MRRFPWLLTLFTAPLMAVLIGLGVWQVQRLHWKEALIAHVEAARAAPPVTLAAGLAAAARGEDVQFRRVAFQCPEVGASPVVQLATTGETAAGEAALGHRYIYACPVSVGPWRSVLVDSGFDEADRVNTCVVEPGAPPPTLIGAFRNDTGRNPFLTRDKPEQRLFYARDIPAMAAALDAPAPAPHMVVLERSQCWAQGRPTPLPSHIANSHLGYAMTWFGLALALAGFYAAMVHRRFQDRNQKDLP